MKPRACRSALCSFTACSSSSPRIGHPSYWGLNYGSLPQDIRHNVSVSGVVELPFGKCKRWATGRAASAVLGGWQLNALSRLSTGTPITPTAPGTVLNAPGSGQFADCFGPIAKIGERTRWWDRSNLADPNAVSPNAPRFGTCGTGILRGPGLINVDMGVFRRIRINERFNVQLRGEAFNVSNTPHFANPNADISSSNFGIIGSVQNTGAKEMISAFSGSASHWLLKTRIPWDACSTIGTLRRQSRAAQIGEEPDDEIWNHHDCRAFRRDARWGSDNRKTQAH